MKRQLIVVAILLLVAARAQAAIVLAPGSTWEYTFTDPTGDPTWNNTTGGAGWSPGQAPFGNNTGGGFDPDFNYMTWWPADGTDGDDLWVRIAVDFTGFDTSTANWGLGVDNGYKLYLNGTQIAAGNAEGYTWQWEYFGGLSPNPGVNIVAVALEDHGGLTAFDMQITASPVPEPSTFIIWSLLGAIGIALGLWRRKAA